MAEDNNNNEQPLINPDDIRDIAEKQSEKGSLTTLASILVGLIIVMILHNSYSIYQMVFDRTIPLVQCPRAFDLDRPVLLKPMTDMSTVSTDNWVKGFIINFTMKMFPRNILDSESFFRYIANHTEGSIQSRYEARVAEIDKINKEIEAGNFAKFWITDSEKIIIRKVSTGKWNAVVYGFMHRRSNGELEKTQPRIEMTVEAVGASLDNPEGLSVTDIRLVQITDPVSGSEIEL